MNGINSLPDELMLIIIHFIQPDDLVAFASTQRRLHSLSLDRLEEHRQKLKKYHRIIIINDGVKPEVNPESGVTGASGATLYSHPRHFFTDLQRDPSIVWYPRALLWDRTLLVDGGEDQDTFKESTFYRDLIRRIPSWKGYSELEELVDRLEKEKGDAYFPVVLFVLPNLSRLRLEQDDTFPSITAVEQDILQNSGLCSNLKKVELYHMDQELLELHWLRPWTALPAVQSLTGSRYTSDARDGEIESRFRPAISNMPGTLKNIKLVECELDGRDLAIFLDGLHNLSSFHFAHAISFSTHWEWNTSAFMEALENSSVQTLQDLTLLFDKAPADQIVSLKNFKSFRSFRGPAEMLPHRVANTDDSDHQLLQLDLQACFPPSISELSLSAHNMDDDPTACPWRISFAKITECDRLKKIVLDSDVASPTSISLMAQHEIEYEIKSLLDPEANEFLQE